MFSYPPYRKNEFSHVNKSLSVVDYWLACKRLEDEHKTAVAEHQKAESERTRTSGAAAAEIRAVLESLVEMPGTQQPTDLFKAAVQHVRSAVTTVGDKSMRERYIHGAAMSCLPLFMKFDKAKFEQFAKLTAPDAEQIDKDLAEKAKTCNSIASRLKAEMVKYKEVFSDRGFLAGCDKGREHRRAFEEATKFVNIWRQRARQFKVPVTIECTAIHTLPEEAKQLWSDAYKKLEFDKLHKTPMYTPYNYQETV